MMQVCRCGRDSIATCVKCGTRLCDNCSSPYFASSWFDVDKEKARVTAKSFGPRPFRITSARENQAARDGWDGDGYSIVCQSCRLSAAAVAVWSLREIPVPDEFGSLSEAASDIIEGRWVQKANHNRPATPQEIDDAISWHMNNRAAEDVHDSWRLKSTKGGYLTYPGSVDVDVKYRKGWTIGSTPDRSVWVDGYDTDLSHEKRSAVVVDRHRQFHLCDPSGRPPTGSGRALRENLCVTHGSARWFDRRSYSRWHSQPPTLLLGDIAKKVVERYPGFDLRSADNIAQGLVSVPNSDATTYWYQPLPL